MKKTIKKYLPVLIILFILSSSILIYKVIHNSTVDRIFSNAEIDIPDDLSNRDDIINIIGNELASGMSNCRITRLYLDGSESEPPRKEYADKGIETTLVKMDFYDSGTSYKGYSWLFIRDNTDNSWTLESYGYIL